jgi:hypothetical protein
LIPGARARRDARRGQLADAVRRRVIDPGRCHIGTLNDINELRRLVQGGQAPPGVQPDSVEAIDHVRQIGNTGAHMEADINVIVDVEPDEAQLLIELVELLFVEWYVARESGGDRLAKLKAIVAAKKRQKLLSPQPAAATQPSTTAQPPAPVT